jgi:arylsulfatase A-like enzyme
MKPRLVSRVEELIEDARTVAGAVALQESPPVPWTRRRLLSSAAALGASTYLGCNSRARARGDGPNVLLLIVDQLRADHALGSRARTPNIDELAAEGLTFTRVFPEAMPTVPVRNAILTGRRMFPFRDWEDQPGLIAKPGWGGVRDVDSTLSSALRRAGWWTGYVTDNPFLGFAAPYEPLRRSFDMFVRIGGQIGGRTGPVSSRAVERWLHPAVVRADMETRVSRYIANADYARDERRSFAARVFGSAVKALDTSARRRPFFLVVDAYEPHEPWTPPRRYTREYGDPDYNGPEPAMPRYGRVENWLTPEETEPVLERLRAVYAAEVTMTDHWLGALLARLTELDLERETIVVLVSDHGVQLGERGWTGKVSVALHPELINVPLIIVDPGRRRAGQTSSYFASTHDLARTILSFADVRVPQGMAGVDLSALLRGGRPPKRSHAYGGYSNNHFVRTERWAYMSDNRFERPELFDLDADPGETRDVAFERPDVVAELREQVLANAGGELPYYE